MSEPSTPSFQGMCHFIGQLSKASKTGMRAALADCPKCHFNMLEGLLHAINCHGKDGAIYVSDLAREIRQPLPAVSRGLRLMEQDGTVVREPDPAEGAGGRGGGGPAPRRPPQNAGAHHPQGVRAVPPV